MFEERLREQLAGKDREWLIDQIVRLSLDRHSMQEIDRKAERDAKAAARADRLERVKVLALDGSVLAAFVGQWRGTTREALVASGHLVPEAPAKGTELLTADDRGEQG